jgi:hypothetical protein
MKQKEVQQTILEKIAESSKKELLKNHIAHLETYFNLHQTEILTQQRFFRYYNALVTEDNIQDLYFLPIDQFITSFINYINTL